MYFISLFFLSALLQFVLIVSFLKPLQLKKIIKINPKGTLLKVFLLAILAGINILLFREVIVYHTVQPYIGTGKKVIGNGVVSSKKIGYRDAKDIENFYYLYLLSDKSQDTLQAVAVESRLADCKKACIVHFYDDKKAYDLDMERLTITKKEEMELWNQSNYIFVADHYLGYHGPSATDTFVLYPFRDWYYHSQKQSRKSRR